MAPARARDRKGHFRLFEAVAAAPRPSVLVIKDVGPRRTHACFLGDVIATITKRLGAIGIVTDGGVRDLEGVKPLGYHVFAAGFVVAHGTFNIEEVGIPVEISGTTVTTRRPDPRRRQRRHHRPAGDRGQGIRRVPEGPGTRGRPAGLRHGQGFHAGRVATAHAGEIAEIRQGQGQRGDSWEHRPPHCRREHSLCDYSRTSLSRSRRNRHDRIAPRTSQSRIIVVHTTVMPRFPTTPPK